MHFLIQRLARKLTQIISAAVLVALSSGCASIASSPVHYVRISSEPYDASFTITDRKGEEVITGTTPEMVELKTSSAPFQKSRYQVEFELEGYETKSDTLNGKVSPWYFGNFLVYYTAIVTALIIDPFTGAMFDLPNELNVILEEAE